MVFSIDQDTRDIIESAISKLNTTHWYNIYREAERKETPVNRDDLQVYLKLRSDRVALGDMYEYIRDIEIALHEQIKNTLISEHGSEDWWRKGVPTNIRVPCATSLETDPEPAAEPYCYTNFIQLGEIMRRQWKTFRKTLPSRLSSSRKKLLSRLARMNSIRNAVMHPAKGVRLTERDFAFVREFRTDLAI